MDTIPPLSLPILLDGATGSELYKRGMPAGACTEQWVLGHPEALLELQRGYVAAGSQVLIAPTFGANRVRLEQHGIFGQVADPPAGGAVPAGCRRPRSGGGGHGPHGAVHRPLRGEQL